MTPRKPVDLDATNLLEAASMLELSTMRMTRRRREGLRAKLDGYPSYSHVNVQEFIDSAWLNGARQASLSAQAGCFVGRSSYLSISPCQKVDRGGRVDVPLG